MALVVSRIKAPRRQATSRSARRPMTPKRVNEAYRLTSVLQTALVHTTWTGDLALKLGSLAELIKEGRISVLVLRYSRRSNFGCSDTQLTKTHKIRALTSCRITSPWRASLRASRARPMRQNTNPNCPDLSSQQPRRNLETPLDA